MQVINAKSQRVLILSDDEVSDITYSLYDGWLRWHKIRETEMAAGRDDPSTELVADKKFRLFADFQDSMEG